jgi:hypothetical protein
MSHEDAFKELNGLKIENQLGQKLDYSKKETWEKLKENLVQNKIKNEQ